MRRHGRFRYFSAFVRGCGLRSLILVALCAANGVFAADDNKIIFPGGNTQQAAPAVPAGGSFNTITLALAVIIAAVGAWMVWRNRRGPITARESNLTIAETRSLGNRQFLVVASYEGRKFLLGVCPGRIDMLTPLSDENRVEEGD